MAKSKSQKLKLMYLAKIFFENTDKAHPLTTSELIEALEAYGVSAERKSVYDDIEALQSFGMDIAKYRTSTTSYYLKSRQFELAELKLLVDAIESSKIITASASRELIKKLGSLTSLHESSELRRDIYMSGKTKSDNEGVYANIDTIHSSVLSNKKINFKYFSWALDFGSEHKIKKEFRRNGGLYTVSPWALIWDSQYYYLIADYYGEMRHYRVDKMMGIEIMSLPREGREGYEALDISAYSQKVFSMFAGEERFVKIRFANRLIGVVVDRYGQDVFVSPYDDENFCATINVSVSAHFFAWVFSFGKEAQILYPADVAENMRGQLQEVLSLYS